MKKAVNGPVNGPGKGPAQRTLQDPLKVLKWILILFIPVNLLVIALSFAFPGKLSCIDNYQVAVQKLVIRQLDRGHSKNIFQWKQADTSSANFIQYAELIPYLEKLQSGTLFFSVHGRRVSKIFIRGEWKHCGIFLGTLQQVEQTWGKDHPLVTRLRPFYAKDDDVLIFDSSYDKGVTIHSVREMADLNHVSTLRKLMVVEPHFNKDTWSQALQSHLSHLEKTYDYCFVLDNDDALYCSEFLREVLPLQKNYFQPSAKIVGRPLLLPSDLVDSIIRKGFSSGTFRSKGCILKKGGTMVLQTLQ